MAETYKKLIQELVDNSNDTLLTVAANTTVIIKSMRAVNTTGTANLGDILCVRASADNVMDATLSILENTP